MITNYRALAKQFPDAQVLLELAEGILQSLNPEQLVQNAVQLKDDRLVIQGKIYLLHNYQHIYVVGAGKATYAMAKALQRLLGKRLTAGYINVPVAYTKRLGTIKVNQASHPLPNQAGVTGARAVLQLVQQASVSDLVICLISGGGSSLLPLPIVGISLSEKLTLTKLLMKAGANIVELNAVRKHLSAIKGGKLAAATKATIVSLVISDVLGDRLDTIASGPTVADRSTLAKAKSILKRYQLLSVKLNHVLEAAAETPKRLNPHRVQNYIIGSNQLALTIAEQLAKRQRLHPFILTNQLQGEARTVAKTLITIAKEVTLTNRPVKTPALLLAGGETTVTVKGSGQGGRNQELVLAAIPELTDHITILSLATDGVDGFTSQPVAGAIANGSTIGLYQRKKLSIDQYLQNNDSYSILKKLGCHIITGPTGTNVGDVVMVLVK